jgi:hypothetical protein
MREALAWVNNVECGAPNGRLSAQCSVKIKHKAASLGSDGGRHTGTPHDLTMGETGDESQPMATMRHCEVMILCLCFDR